MASYRVLLKPSAASEIAELDSSARAEVLWYIGTLSHDPRPAQAELICAPERYRAMANRWALVYSVDDVRTRVVISSARDVTRPSPSGEP